MGPGDGSGSGDMRSKGLLPALGVGGAVYLATSVVSFGTLAVAGAGAGIGYAGAMWLGTKYREAQDKASAARGTPAPEESLPEAMRVSLGQWQAFIGSRAAGHQVTPSQLAALWAEFEQAAPGDAQNVQSVQALMASGQLVPVNLLQRAGVTIVPEAGDV
mmetsp:Transcript_45/g.158  ORF Transcript_45/g.158 Transcript_45/m.158 type:complete len:160 (+) Transcript_45:67-546(+)|eukprot:CAMPEP_0170613818 /NCGR_PEP_ID=MMETSP0224-20130122/24473_1 /TAXON_ID=285029 /ORGANISM="Togula jolla, Strain CCCM 725" /LENGTH=159 /DNA_ID=CAMNT_0010939441 /DNA_START=67 /DNA_END=546 /DNA_ORIENTATION=+